MRTRKLGGICAAIVAALALAAPAAAENGVEQRVEAIIASVEDGRVTAACGQLRGLVASSTAQGHAALAGEAAALAAAIGCQ